MSRIDVTDVVDTVPLTKEHFGAGDETGNLKIRAGRKVRNLVAPSIFRKETVTVLFFPKVEVGIGQAPPGSWFKSDGDVLVVCPVCGLRNIIELGPGAYKVDARGVLFPSVLCEKDSCSFDRYVCLKGWTTMGRLGRKKDNLRGVIFYSMAWRKWNPKGQFGPGWYLQPFEYTHAVSQEEAMKTFQPILDYEKGMLVGVAPSIDPHVSGDGDAKDSILHL
jgi:hypothetical protein